MNPRIIALLLSGTAFLNNLAAQTIAKSTQSKSNYTVLQSSNDNPDLYEPGKHERTREALLPLLRAVFNSRWEDQEVLLTVDAGWRKDSLSIEYKYYKGNNLLALNDNLLVEKIYFTVKPEELDALDTEIDEFQFLYLRNKKKISNVHQIISRPSAGVKEEIWRSSFGFPVLKENLPMIIQLLKDLRTTDQQ